MSVLPVQKIKDFLILGIKQTVPANLSQYAEQILELHLNENNFAMPIKVDSLKVQQAFLNGMPENAASFITFENTNSIQGICRVMIRTHLNRSGVGLISRGSVGSIEKTLPPRALDLFDGDFKPEMLLNWENLISGWLEIAKKRNEFYQKTNNYPDIESLEGLLEISPEEVITSVKNGNLNGIHNNWAKFAVGVHSGFVYLNNRFQLNAENVNTTIDNASRNFNDVTNLINDARINIYQYGTALAGNFFADLGKSQFVKTDVHVMDAINTFSHCKVSEQDALNIIYESSQEFKISPRALDKLLYLNGSLKLYLIGINARDSAQHKESFLNMLGNG
jgi:hypothetical protein